MRVVAGCGELLWSPDPGLWQGIGPSPCAMQHLRLPSRTQTRDGSAAFRTRPTRTQPHPIIPRVRTLAVWSRAPRPAALVTPVVGTRTNCVLGPRGVRHEGQVSVRVGTSECTGLHFFLKSSALLVPSHGGKVGLVGESGRAAPLLTGAAAALGRPSDAGASDAPHSVTPTTRVRTPDAPNEPQGPGFRITTRYPCGNAGGRGNEASGCVGSFVQD